VQKNFMVIKSGLKRKNKYITKAYSLDRE